MGHVRALSRRHRRLAAVCGACLLAGRGRRVSAQQRPPRCPSEPPKQFGASVTGAFEGWFDNADGTHNFLVGYFNRNLKQAHGRPDRPEQPHRAGRSRHGPADALPAGAAGPACSSCRVPKDFTPQQRLTWTLTVNGQSTHDSAAAAPDYNVNPFSRRRGRQHAADRAARGEQGPALQGPVAHARTRAGSDDGAGRRRWRSRPGWTTTGSPRAASNAPMRKAAAGGAAPGRSTAVPATVTFDAAQPKLEVLEGGGLNDAVQREGHRQRAIQRAG